MSKIAELAPQQIKKNKKLAHLSRPVQHVADYSSYVENLLENSSCLLVK